MNWEDFRRSFNEARDTIQKADDVANSMADMLDGRLKKVTGYTLARLKRQLRDFNIQTHKWKDD